MATNSSRRRFLRLGIGGALALAAAGGAYRLLQGAPRPAPYLPDAPARAALRAIAASLLRGTGAEKDPAALDKAVETTFGAVATLPLATQKEIADLFGLLTLGATRRLLAGVPDDWAQAKPADVDAFLDSWRHHRLAMLQSAYGALHDLVLGPWYGLEENWAAIGYPGPMKGF